MHKTKIQNENYRIQDSIYYNYITEKDYLQDKVKDNYTGNNVF